MTLSIISGKILGMKYGRWRRFIPAVIIIIVVVVAVVGLVSLGRFLFSPSGVAPTIDTSRETLLSTNAGHAVRMTLRGPIVANEDFRSYQITITPNSRTLTTYAGYSNKVVDQVSLPNTVKAYDEFVHALDKANLAQGRAFEGEKNNLSGICASGRLINFEIIKDNEVVKNLWTSNCKRSPGSLNASSRVLGDLFRAQIPESRELIREVKLYY